MNVTPPSGESHVLNFELYNFTFLNKSLAELYHKTSKLSSR
jgi:hypothetical protein